jgi:4-nitrophenol 2-monooxygenase / 4-nitrocatechol 4-monooxygenase, reductase component
MTHAELSTARAFGQSLVHADDFRHAIGHFPTGVCVVTTAVDGQGFGATVSSLASLSLEPPMLLVCLKHTSKTLRAVKRRGAFVVNLLAEDQAAVASHFAATDGAKITVDPRDDDLPRIEEALATIECDVESMVRGGSHIVITAVVQHVTTFAGHPLAYYRGRFGGFVPALTLVRPAD